MAQQREIYVYYDNVPMGVLFSELLRGKEVFYFEYDPNWLKCKDARLLDPDLQLFSGKQYLPIDKSNFGLFLDSSPDRWGRLLMRRREAVMARSEGRKINQLTETDYLLGVYDGNRMGALRFKLSPDGDFMDNNKALATPPWASIRELEYASLQLEQESHKNDAEYIKWLNMLLAPGSSLGGARPKANILDNDGNLWIAKFPSSHDSKNMGAWEAVTAQMAKMCGINMAECRAQRFSGAGDTFLTKRFDRDVNGSRIHFASAMTMLGYSDGADGSSGVSYLELVEWITRNCCNVEYNLVELFRRIAFNVAVSNCDDHLRNHGFIYTSDGWSLSPAYDINPDELGLGLKLNISEDDISLDFDLVRSVAQFFGVSDSDATAIIDNIKEVVSNWRVVATKHGISRGEQELMETAFRY